MIAQDMSPDLVDHVGEAVTVRRTPKGVGKNTGTKDKPLVSPPAATGNHGHTETRTTNNNAK